MCKDNKNKIILKDVLEKMHAVAVLNKMLPFIEAFSLCFFEQQIIFNASCALFTFTWLSLIFMLDKCEIGIILAWDLMDLIVESLRQCVLALKSPLRFRRGENVGQYRRV